MPERTLRSTKNGRRATHRRKNGAARPIRSKRDYVQAADVVERLKQEIGRESDAELRLQSLLAEMEQYDADMADFDDFEADFSFEDEYDGPLRRWSDDPNDLD